MDDLTRWDPRPPSPPSTSRPFPPARTLLPGLPLPDVLPSSSGAVSNPLPIGPIGSIGPQNPLGPGVPAGLGSALGTSPPQTPTASASSQPVEIPRPTGLVSPPTPAPSPGPPRRWAFEKEYEDMEEGVREMWVTGQGSAAASAAAAAGLKDGQGKGKGKDFGDPASLDPQDLLLSFRSFSSAQRFAFLSALVGELRQNEALVVSRRIEPRLKRDFLRELPVELALHCLSFVDEARTLGRASQVSRFWNQLLQDQNIWREMCERHRFSPVPSPITRASVSSATSSRSPISASTAGFASLSPPSTDLGPGASTAAVNGNGITIAKSQDPLEAFGVSIRGAGAMAGRRRSSDKGDGSGPFKIRAAREGIDERSFKQQFKHAYMTQNNWLHGGRILASFASGDDGVVTSLAMDEKHIVIAMANSHIHIFDAPTGSYRRSLIGHDAGVWALVLVSASPRRSSGGVNTANADAAAAAAAVAATSSRMPRRTSQTYRSDDGIARRASFGGAGEMGLGGAMPSSAWSPGSISRPNTAFGFSGPGIKKPRAVKREKQSDPSGAVKGWGLRRSLVVSGGCDRVLRVWDLETGQCVHALEGHSSTIRCLRVLDGRPIAVTGSRDGTLRVWDIHRGRLLHTLVGHEHSVRCIEIAGNMVVSGSYDRTARVWDVDTGECIHVLRGHYHQIYACAFDGLRIVTGSLDATVRIWSAATGDCIALLQGHTSLVGQLQLIGDTLVTGGSDGRVICFDLSTLECRHRICAHDNSVTCLQQDDRWIISGGNDGRVKLFSVETGEFVRDLTRPCDAVWRVTARDDRVVILCQRGGGR
ncbi:hypothetical protein EHS25_002198 [Saitozyma podzolica]|uniref:F-box domain-containing protein n=1 Tax=Saitozyma podzolica TaxID=1890683 RepID=A0A427YF93_9TREE|nr:hypothetical protein EHS25_002198 [Saitozyma podzolica]